MKQETVQPETTPLSFKEFKDHLGLVLDEDKMTDILYELYALETRKELEDFDNE